MKHTHHRLLSFGKKDNTNGKWVQYRRQTCEEYEARYASGWKFFPTRKHWFIAWRIKT